MSFPRRGILQPVPAAFSGALLVNILLLGNSSPAGERPNSESKQERPNIVIILTDDLGYGDVSFLNAESKIETPHMDALAAEGVWATDAHSPCSVCSPTRYALLTGRYPWRGKLKHGVLLPWDEPLIEKGRLTLPAMLKKKGFATACIGKWHLGFYWPWKSGEKPPVSQIGGKRSQATNAMFDWSRPITGGPLAAGFDYYFGDDVPNFPPYAFIENESITCEPVDIDADTLKAIGIRGFFFGSGPGEEGWTLEKVMPTITRRAVDYVQQRSKKPRPFFLLFTTTSPHTPVVPTKDFQGKSKAGYYGDYVIQTDDAIGQVVRALKQSGVFDNTLLIVTSDNGPSPYHRDLIRSHQHYPAGPLRGMKRDIWEGGHRVPLVASWPKGRIRGGHRIDAMLCLTDVFASIAAIVEEPLPRGAAEDSLNILPTLHDNKPVRIEMVYQAINGALGLRDKNWVYLRYGGEKEPDWYREIHGIDKAASSTGPVQLFDLAVDEGERVNLSDAHKDRAKAMDARLREIENSDRSR